MNAEEKRIPKACSIKPADLAHIKQNGLTIFNEIMETNREQNMLKQENWNIIIDYILENCVFTDNKIPHCIELLDHLRQCASECLIPQSEKRIISLNHKHFVNAGCLEFFVHLGFFQLDHDLIIMDPEEDIINTATMTMFKRIEILKLSQQLQSLWTQCISLMAQHPDYQSQRIFPLLLPYDLSLNYSQYMSILEKLCSISTDCIPVGIESFAVEILRCIGFNIFLIQHENMESNMIWSTLCNIYALFNKIERIKQSIWRNKNVAPAIKMEPKEAEKILPITSTKGIDEFRDILAISCAERKYEQLLSGENWDNLIDCICVNLRCATNSERKKRLNSLKHIAEKATRNEEKFRKIDTSKKTAQRKIGNIYGSETYLHGLGFIKEADSPYLYLHHQHLPILRCAIDCINHAVSVMDKLDALNAQWQRMISQMKLNDQLSAQQVDLLQTLSAMDVSFDGGDAYDEMKMHINDVHDEINNNANNDHDIGHLMFERLGINFFDVTASNSMISFYFAIRKVESCKMERHEVNMMANADGSIMSKRMLLNELWQNCIFCMAKHETFEKQSYVIEDIKSRDFTAQNDYEWLVNEIETVGQMKVYSHEIEAAQEMLRHLTFQLPQKPDADEQHVLNYVVNIYQKVEQIFSGANKKETKLIRISGDQDVEENAMRDHDFRIENTPMINPKVQREEEIYHESLMPLKLRAAAATIIKCEENILNCRHVQKILKSLNFVDSLNLLFASGQDELVRNFKEKHTTILEDFMHLKGYHDDELYQICENWGLKCRYDLYCAQLQRYHGEQQWNTEDGSALNSDFIFYRDTMDSIHCYMYHLFDLGLRVNVNQMNNMMMHIVDEEHEADDDGFVFLEERERDNKNELEPLHEMKVSVDLLPFAQHQHHWSVDLSPQHKKDSNLSPVVKHKNKKSLLPLLSVQSANFRKHKEGKFKLGGFDDESCTFMDGMVEYVTMQCGTCVDLIQILFQQEAFDSDALLDDIEDDDYSFIGERFSSYLNHIVKYSHFTSLIDKSFSIGFRFYYWDYYRDKDDVEVEYFQNIHFHSGYAPYELFVAAKWRNIKEEVLYNSQCTLSLREFEKSLDKAHRYLNVSSIREICAEENVFLHYDIWDGEPLLEEHLLSVTLYCDWSALCTAFSATFRMQHAYEHLVLVKKRNSDFAKWSQRLRETVELYGKRGWEKREMNEVQWNLEHQRIRGPFYCGCDQMMVLPQFNIRLCAPTSSSSSFSVATTFAGDEGIIITLNNNGHWHSDNLRIWDCSWLSGFQGEDEKLIMGGFYTIRIQGIQVLDNYDNYEAYFLPLFYLDCMLTGISMLRQRPLIQKWHKKLCNDLLYCRYSAYQNQQYIVDTVEAYKNQRQHMVINLHQIATYFKKLAQLFLESAGSTWQCEVCFSRGNSIHSSRCWMCTATNSPATRGVNNLLKLSALEQFPNLQHIVLYTTSGTGRHEYVFDCTKLLNNLINYVSSDARNRCGNTKLLNIQIKATHRYQIRDDTKITHQELSWLSHEWEQYGKNLQSFLKSFNSRSSIKLIHTENRGARVYKEDTLNIKIFQ